MWESKSTYDLLLPKPAGIMCSDIGEGSNFDLY